MPRNNLCLFHLTNLPAKGIPLSWTFTDSLPGYFPIYLFFFRYFIIRSAIRNVMSLLVVIHTTYTTRPSSGCLSYYILSYYDQHTHFSSYTHNVSGILSFDLLQCVCLIIYFSIAMSIRILVVIVTTFRVLYHSAFFSVSVLLYTFLLRPAYPF